MGTATRGVAGLLFALFVGGLVLRPLVTNPTVFGALSDGPAGPEVLFVAPLVVLSVLVVVLRLRSDAGSGDGEAFTDRHGSDTPSSDESWGVERGAWGNDHEGDATGHGAGTATGEGERSTEADLLGGQGGTRERGFEMEADPPEARLSDHLEHLREELDDDTAAATDLETLASGSIRFPSGVQSPTVGRSGPVERCSGSTVAGTNCSRTGACSVSSVNRFSVWTEPAATFRYTNSRAGRMLIRDKPRPIA